MTWIWGWIVTLLLYAMACTICFGLLLMASEGTFCRVDGGDANGAIGDTVLFVINKADGGSIIVFRDGTRVDVRDIYWNTLETLCYGFITIGLGFGAYEGDSELLSCSQRVLLPPCRAGTGASPPALTLQTTLSIVVPLRIREVTVPEPFLALNVSSAFI